MILLNHVIQVLVDPDERLSGQYAFGIQFYDWDFPLAEREFKRALQLDPKSADARRQFAEFLALTGRHEEASRELNRAVKLAPRSLPVKVTFGALAYYSRDYKEAIRRLKKALEFDDAYAPVHTRLGLVYEQQGDMQDAVLSFLRAGGLLPVGPERTSALRRNCVGGIDSSGTANVHIDIFTCLSDIGP